MTVTIVPELSFTSYDAAEAASMGEELAHLRALDTAGGRGADAAGADVLTARLGARLVGYVAGSAGAVVDVTDVVLVDAVRRTSPGAAGALVETFVERAARPWADVVMPRDAAALAHLLAAGWDPVPDPDAESRRRVRLSGARGSGR